MLIAEDLLLLLTDDRTGRLAGSGTEVDVALGGALLVELTMEGRVEVTEDGGMLRRNRVTVRDAAPTGDEVLDEALARRVQVVTALRNGLASDERTATLVSLLHALRKVHKAVEPASVGMSRRDLAAGAKRIAEGEWASQAVRRAIDNINAAVVAATATAGAAAAGS